MTILSLFDAAKTALDNYPTNPVFYAGVLAFLYEIFVRLKPTKRNLSILDAMHKILAAIVPNWRAQTKTEINNQIKDKFKIK